jgi:ABC-type sugar transport system ATPase subunit
MTATRETALEVIKIHKNFGGVRALNRVQIQARLQ